MAANENDHLNGSAGEPKTLTTQAGRPVADNQNSLTAGPRGPVLMEDFQLIEKMAQFNRERIPERVVHAKGSGAYGHFRVTERHHKIHHGASCSRRSAMNDRGAGAVFNGWRRKRFGRY